MANTTFNGPVKSENGFQGHFKKFKHRCCNYRVTLTGSLVCTGTPVALADTTAIS